MPEKRGCSGTKVQCPVCSQKWTSFDTRPAADKWRVCPACGTRFKHVLHMEPEAEHGAGSAERHDSVNSPSHYCKGGFELGEVLYAWNLPHRRASAVEYIMRAGDKDPAKEREDLRKAIRNLEMELDYMERYGDHHAGRSHRQALQRPDAVVPLVSGRRKGARRIHHTGRGADGCHKSGMRGSDGDMRDASRSALGGANHREVRNRAIGKPLSKPFPSCAALHNFAFRCKV